MKAVAKSGARRFTIGNCDERSDEQAGREDRPGVARSEARHRRLVMVAERRHLRNIRGRADRRSATRKITNAEADEEHQRQRDRVHQQHHAEEAQRGRERSAERERPAWRIVRVVRALDHLRDVVEEEPDEERRHRRDQEAEPDQQADPGEDIGKAVSSHA